MQVMRTNGHPCPATQSGGSHKCMKGNEVWWTDSPSSRDEGLTLFQDIKSCEHKNFLHPSMDDIEISLSTKLGGLSGLRNAAPQTPPWKGNDLLATGAEKTDYDWLLTPPGTPLFPSLDKDSMQTYMEQNVQAKTSSASRSSRVYKSLSGSNMSEVHSRMARRSPSPRTPTSLASTSSSSTFTMRGRAPSPSRAGSSPTPRPATPTKSLGRSTTMTRAVPTRSSPPTLRRTNTSPSVRSSSAERNGPPAKGRSRGSSISPKLQAWQAPELGFSAEPPPNLRTSLSNRSLAGSRSTTSRARPGSHYGEARHSYSEGADTRHSLWCNSSSSSASKFSSSTTSQDHWSSRGSIISSSDDGMDAAESTFLDSGMTSPSSTSGTSRLTEVSSKCSPAASRLKWSPNSSEVIASAKKSLEPSMQRMDHRYNMFRPLLSSAPTSSFHTIGRTMVRHRPTSLPMEPSITASSNASSEKGERIFPGNESSDEGEDEAESKWDGAPHPGASAITTLEMDGIEQESIPNSTSSQVAADLSEVDMAMDISTNDLPADEPLARIKTGHVSAPCEASHHEPSPSFPSKADDFDHPIGPCQMAAPHQATQHHPFPPSQSKVDECDNLMGPCHMATPHQATHHKPLPRSPNNTDECENSIGPGNRAAPHQDTHHNLSLPPPTNTDECDCVIGLDDVAAPHQATHVHSSPPPPGNMDDLIGPDNHRVVSLQSATYKAANKIPADILDDPSLHGNGIPCSVQSHTLYFDTHDPKEEIQGSNTNCLEYSNSDEESIQRRTESFGCPSPTNGSLVDVKDAPLPCTTCAVEVTESTSLGHILVDSRGDAPCLQFAMSAPPMPFSEMKDAYKEGENAVISKSSQHNLKLQKSCIDMPQPADGVLVRESESQKLIKHLSFGSSMDDEEASAVSNAISSHPHASNVAANMTDEDDIYDERMQGAMVRHDAAKDRSSREEEASTPFMNKNFESVTRQLDAIIASQDNLTMEQGEDGDGFSEEDIARDISQDGHDIDLNQSTQSANGCIQSRLSSEEVLQILDEPPRPCLEELWEQACSSETRSLDGAAPEPDQEEVETPKITSLLEEGQQQHLSKASSSGTSASPVSKTSRLGLSLEEATNTILFCSSIVHDLVYKATSIAAEKEAMAEAVVTGRASSYPIRRQDPNADHISSLRWKESKAGTRKGAAKPSVKRSHKEAAVDVSMAIMQHPTPIVGMEKVEADKALPTNTIKENSHYKLSVNSNCQCTVM